MASVFFANSAGQVSFFNDPTLPAMVSLRLEDWHDKGGFPAFRSIITGVTVAEEANYQFLHTIGGSIYVYVFGDKIGHLSLQGLAFSSVCFDTGTEIGIERVSKYYDEHRLTKRKLPLRISLGVSLAFTAYLVGFNAGRVDPKTRIYEFGLNLALVPSSVTTREIKLSGPEIVEPEVGSELVEPLSPTYDEIVQRGGVPPAPQLKEKGEFTDDERRENDARPGGPNGPKTNMTNGFIAG